MNFIRQCVPEVLAHIREFVRVESSVATGDTVSGELVFSLRAVTLGGTFKYMVMVNTSRRSLVPRIYRDYIWHNLVSHSWGICDHEYN